MIVTTLLNSENLAKSVAKELKVSYSKTEVRQFPDGEIYIRYSSNLKNKKLVIVESFQPNANASLMRIIFASKTAKELGASKVILVAPYLGFMRQDKRFNSGECVSAPIMADLLNKYVDKVITVDPHLHRILKMSDVFTIPAKNVTANHLIAKYIAKKYKNVAVIGPDWESYQWADIISKEIGVEDTVLEKTRHTSRNVDVKVKKQINVKGKNVVIVDDIISTGNTMIKAAKTAKELGAKTVNAIGVHGLFVEKGYAKMQKAGFNDIVTCNTIVHPTNKIDITSVIVQELKNENLNIKVKTKTKSNVKNKKKLTKNLSKNKTNLVSKTKNKNKTKIKTKSNVKKSLSSKASKNTKLKTKSNTNSKIKKVSKKSKKTSIIKRK